MKISRVPCKIETFNRDNTNLLKVKLWVQHDGKNKNKSKFDLENIKKAEPTIKNTPILAYIKRGMDGEVVDFDEHNTLIKLTDDGVEIQYLERPIGVIPSDTEITYEEIDDKTYICATGYIWKRYANEGLNLIVDSDEKGVSMEIEVHESSRDKKDGYINITDYSYLGVTILGDDIEPGMFDTKLEKYSSNKKYKKILEDIYKEIYSFRKEETVMENEKQIEEKNIEQTLSIDDTKNIEDQEGLVDSTENEEKEIKLSYLSIDNLKELVNSQLFKRTIERKDYWGDIYQDREFYLKTLIHDENIAIVQSSKDHNLHYGIPYIVDGDNVVLDFENKIEYIHEWRIKNSEEVIETYSIEDEFKHIILEKFGKKEVELDSLKEELEKYKVEVNSLREFKANKDKEALTIEVNNVISEFSLEEDEIKVFKERAINDEITIDELKRECFCLVGMKALSNRATFSKEDAVKGNVVVPVITTEDKPDMYGGLIKKHLS